MNKATERSEDSKIDLDGQETEAGKGFRAPWPGVKYAKGDERFQAIVGTAHGRGIVQLLVTHEDLMPAKNIESVTMFTTKEGGNCHLWFTLTE